MKILIIEDETELAKDIANYLSEESYLKKHISRIYLGVHFPSDIAGGYMAGLFWVFFCILLINLIHFYRKRKVD